MAWSGYRLVVFDLDFTVWDAGGVWCDCLTWPFRMEAGRVLDAKGARVRVYDGIEEALSMVAAAGVELAVASRTTEPEWARELLDLLGLRSFFAYEEIYPSSKLRHFSALREKTGYAFGEMLFFDDEERNIVEVGGLGVRAVRVRDGFKGSLFEREWTGSGK